MLTNAKHFPGLHKIALRSSCLTNTLCSTILQLDYNEAERSGQWLGPPATVTPSFDNSKKSVITGAQVSTQL